MTTRKSRQNPAIRDFILRNAPDHSADLANITGERFGISRAAVNRYMHRLEAEGLIEGEGHTVARRYRLKPLADIQHRIKIEPNLAENEVWTAYMERSIGDIAQNVKDICYYGFSEMFNNVIDHSRSPDAVIRYTRNYVALEMQVVDHGVGIFEKIQEDFRLTDQRTALLELAKGKLTSDSARHSGEGIFFTSRMFDEFSIRSGNLFYSKKRRDDWGWFTETEDVAEHLQGTAVAMKIATDADWTIQDVFEKFTAKDDEISFIKTHVPIALGKYGAEQLVSRSQAKRVLARFDKFKEILLDFQGVKTIGQPFADEIFRVFQNQHPHIRIVATNTTPEIERMIAHVTSAANAPTGKPPAS